MIYLFCVILLLFALSLFRGRKPPKSQVSSLGAELAEPFHAEVLLDGQPVATLSKRVMTDMFWRSYTITPLSPKQEDVLKNDDLWDACRFTFRDPASGQVCLTGFCGGNRPYVRDGIVSLRGLYFSTAPESHESLPATALH
ncbi:hypothetical protein [Prosthecobacter sp.]|uniref:hypothetical protein n=1 Tax=Prosthecobacter sp. TaxID=1965333 RepID=UPI00378354A8